MKYKVIKFVDAMTVQEAMEKAKNAPVLEVFVAQKEWDDNRYGSDKSPEAGFDVFTTTVDNQLTKLETEMSDVL